MLNSPSSSSSSSSSSSLLLPIKSFLKCETPQAWLDEAAKKENLSVILIDHLICELKAAQSAMFLIRKYAVDKISGDALLAWLQPFETLIYKREGDWRDLAAKNKLTKAVIPKSDSFYGQDLIDKLIVGAYIEARSCERFAMLAPYVDKKLGDFYFSLLRSEARHFQDYLTLAKEIAGPEQSAKVDSRIAYFAEVEVELITSLDSDFKFHSGLPA